MQDAILSALQPYGLKAAGPNQYRCNAPWRAGSNSRGVAITIDPDAPGGGLWHDHVAKEGGDFLDLAPRLNIPVPQDIAPKAPAKETAYEGLGDYAAAHGVPAAVLAAAGWREDTWRHRDGRRSRALRYPTPHGDRYRLIDGGDTKYIQAPGYAACLFGITRAVRLAEQTGQPLVLCNGEVSTIVAQHYGVAAFCQNMGEKKLTAENLAQLQAEYPAGAIDITPDCDDTGRRTAAELYTQLTAIGYSVRILDLNGAKGFDLANFAQLHQHDTAAALLTLPEIPAPLADAVVYMREMERLRQENEQLRAELKLYRDREVFQAKILARKDIKLGEKAVIMAMEPVLRMRREMGRCKDEHSGTVPASYQRLGEYVATSPSTVGRAIEIGEQIGMWRRDPETKQTKEGYDIQLQRLELLPAFDDPSIAQPVERKQHGGARPGAGRRPKCPTCGPNAPVIEEVTIVKTLSCGKCERILASDTQQERRELQPDEGIQDEIGDEAQQIAGGNQDEIESTAATATEAPSVTPENNQDEMGDVYNVYSVSSLPAVPPILEETADLTAAILCADRLPLTLGDLQRNAFKRAQVWLGRREPDKAIRELDAIQDPLAQAIIVHLAARPMAQAVAA